MSEPAFQTVPAAGWRFAVDRGGTFTDVIGVAPDGSIHTAKVLSERVEGSGDAISEGIEKILRDQERRQVCSIRLGTTVATNALLTRTGVPTALVVTRGLKDLVWIRDQSRPDLFALEIWRPDPIAAKVIEARGRMLCDGSEVEPLDEQGVTIQLEAAFEAGCRAVAVCLMHGWKNDRHEKRVAEIAQQIGFEHVWTSRDVPLRSYVPRLATLTADASLTPILRASLEPVVRRFAQAEILGMQSNGGLVGVDFFRGVNAVLSGPAGGVVGAAAVAESAGFAKAVTLDMGGTSTDVAWWDGTLYRGEEMRIAGERLRVPMLEIHTIAAGGGSICTFDGQRMRVGPESAGAAPGPACYGWDGPLTLTDCNAVLGRVAAEFMPRVFGPGQNAAIDVDRSRCALESVCRRMRESGLDAGSVEQVAEGFVTIAVESMAAAVRRISIERGRSLQGAALVGFGGAGGQCACRVAEALSIDTVLLHPLAGLLSAWGIARADRRVVRRASVECVLDDVGRAQAEHTCAQLEIEAREELGTPEGVRIERRAALKLADWEHGLDVALGPIEMMREQFAHACRARFGYDVPREDVHIAHVEVEAICHIPVEAETCVGRGRPGLKAGQVNLWLAGRRERVDWFDRASLRAGQVIEGAALVRENGATTVIDPGWRARVLDNGVLRLDRVRGKPGRRCGVVRGDQHPADPTRLAVFGRRFSAIAEEMGAALRRTARSVNMRVRLDYSCAVFDADGALVANGEHMPVHLGSMSESVRHIIRARAGDVRPGDAILLNDPWHGGTHLPDLTLISPFCDQSGVVRAFVASRGHHVDVGGTTPGSMPPDARTIEEEGVVIDNFLLCRDGQVNREGLRALLCAGPYPCRLWQRVMDDLEAQLAANQRGLDGLKELAGEYSLETVFAFMRHLQDHAEECVAARLRHLPDGNACMLLDGGGAICVALRVDRQRGAVEVDFAGTCAQREDNLNAPPAVTRACVLYVLRCLIADEIPLNDGCLRRVQIFTPEGSMLNPRPGAAVAGGNVETSQIVVDALLAAAGAQAASQGTMNNLTFGNADVQYYETICGGTGAGPGFAGAHAVHSHMTNSRLTDPEILEDEFPVRLVRFERRVGSGGHGAFQGGDGVVRELEFCAPVTLSLLAGRREHAPPGVAGGGPGMPGTQHLIDRQGHVIELAGRFTRSIAAQERLVIQTPGGGAWGAR